MNDQQNFRPVVTPVPGQGWDYGLIPHPFYDEEAALGVQYCVYNRRLMAVSFAGTTMEEEYWLLRRRAGALHTGEHTTEIRGPDAVRLLNRVFTRDVAKVKVGRCSYQLACYPDGGLIVDGVLLRLGPDRFWYAQADGDLYPWLLAHGMDMDVEVFNPEIFISQVQGPDSLNILDAAVDGSGPDPFRYFATVTVSIAGQDIVISRTGYTNELGWEFYLEQHHDYQAIWTAIKRAGEPFGMGLAGLDAYEPRRIEAGILNAGSDFDTTCTPFDSGLGDFVDLSKDDFIGKAALEKAGRQCRLFGLRCADGVPRWQGEVRKDTTPVGVMTCGARSPYLDCGVGLVRLTDAGHGPGTVVSVQCVDGEFHAAEICTVPMYDEERQIPRGLNNERP